MYSKSDNIEIMINDEADEAIEELLKSLQKGCQNNLEKLMKGSELLFDYVDLLYYRCHKINPNRFGSNIDFPGWIKNKKATINLINKKDNKYFQYAVTITLNYEEINKDLQRITKSKPFINRYNWHGFSFPSEKDDWKKIEKYCC